MKITKLWRSKKLSRKLAGGLVPLLVLALVLTGAPVFGDSNPTNPHQFYGNVTVCQQPAEEGTVVSAWINGVEYASTTVDDQGQYGYSPLFFVPADESGTPGDQGGRNGDTVEFYLDGQKVGEAIFQIDGTTNLDFVITQNFDLTLSSTAGGNVTTPGEGTFPYACGSTVDLVATPENACYEFINWTGDVGTVADVNDPTTQIIVNGDYNVVANFDIAEYTLTVNASPVAGGTVGGGGTFDCGSNPTITATENAGYNFTGWTGTGIADPNSATTTVLVDGDKTVTANFTPEEETCSLTLSSTAGGNVTTPGEGTFPYACGTTVDLVATPENACYEFINWTGDVGTVADVNDPTTQIIVNGDYNVVANFNIAEYTLTVNASPVAGGTVGGGGTFDCGSNPTITATENAGYNFTGWTGTGIANPAALSTTVLVDGDKTVTANFTPEEETCSLTLSSTAGGNVTTPGEGTFPYACGTTVDLVATPENACYEFTNWTGDVSTVADVNDPTTQIIVNGDYNVVANFNIAEYTLTVNASPVAGGTVGGGGTFDCGSNPTITATENAGYDFTGWTGTGIADPNSATTTVLVDGDKTVTANFTPEGETCDLILSSTAGGDVTTPGEGTFPYTCGTTVNMVATPTLSCYRFVNWTGDVGTVADVDDPTTTVLVNSDLNITANFEIQVITTITLQPGWNTFSTPIDLHPCVDTWNEFATFSGLNAEIVYYFNTATQSWTQALGGHVLMPLNGFYVKMASQGTAQIVPDPGDTIPPSRMLTSGLNLVGPASLSDKSVTNTLMSVYELQGGGMGYSQVMSPPINTPNNWEYTRDEAIPVPVMKPGEAYWVVMVNPATLTGYTSTPIP